MFSLDEPAFRLASTVAIGLLIGAERDRRKGEGRQPSAAGIRTLALVSLRGGVSVILGGNLLLAVATEVVAAIFCAAAYLRSRITGPGELMGLEPRKQASSRDLVSDWRHNSGNSSHPCF